ARVDHAHHGANAYRALTDTVALSEAVAAALAAVDPEETLVVVTSDHGHVFNITGYPARGNPILGLVRPPHRGGEIMRTPPSLGRDGRPYTTLGYYTGPATRTADGEALTDEIAQAPDF